MLHRASLVFCFSVVFFSAVAQQSDSTAHILDAVTITSSLIPTSASHTGRNIVTIPGSTFGKLPVNSVDELLRYVPGVEVQSRGPMGAQSDFVLRGGTFQQVLVLIDGNRINDPNSGHFTSYIPITPAQIERVEVLKGASSAIYGSDAVGGVINIITKGFSKPTERKELLNQISGGQYGLFNISAGGLFQAKKTSVDAGFLSNNADGQHQRGTRGSFHNNTISVGANHHFSEQWSLGLRVSWDSRDFGAQNFYSTAVSDTAHEKVTTLWNQLRLMRVGAKSRFAVQSAYKNVHDTYQFNDLGTPNKSTSTLFQSLVTYEYMFSQSTRVLAGAQFQNRAIESNDRGHHVVKQAAGFLILQQTITDKLTVNPALRVDYDERSGTELVPQLNLSYATGAFQFRGSAGKTIRQADFTERYNNYNKTTVSAGMRVGNPELIAEKSFSYEVGADWWALDTRVKISASLFRQDFSRLIDYVSTPYASMPRQGNLIPGASYALARNIADVTTSGAETDIFLRTPIGNGKSLFATAGLLWLKSESPSGNPSLYLSNHAKFLANFSSGIAMKRFGLSATGVYKNRATQAATLIDAKISSSYFVFNAKAEFFAVPDFFTVFVQCDNIGDSRYSDLLGAQMPGRWLMGGIKLKL